MRYAVIGTGAIGGYYGAMLARAGSEVHFLLHSDYDYVLEHGLHIDSFRGPFSIDRPNVYRSAADMPVCDIVLVGLKTTNNRLLPGLLAHVAGPHTLVLLIQNGIGVEADVEAAVPGAQLAAGLAFICSAKTEPGRVRHTSNGSINIGNYSCREPRLLDALMADFGAAGVRAAMVDYDEARWKKAMWNMPFNGLSVALNATTDRLIAPGPAARLVSALMDEVSGAAAACGVTAADRAFADKMVEMTRRMPPYAPSMKLDYDYRRPMEIYYLYTRPIEEARRRGFEMPRMAMLEELLRFAEERWKQDGRS